jgi:hypothetical protein
LMRAFGLGYFDNATCLRLILVSYDPLDAIAVEALVDAIPVGE